MYYQCVTSVKIVNFELINVALLTDQQKAIIKSKDDCQYKSRKLISQTGEY